MRVEAAAEKLGYTANLAAQATARGTSAVTALIVRDMTDPSFGALTRAIAHEAESAGLIVTVAETGGDDDRERKLVQSLRGQRPRGLILGAGLSGAGGPAAGEIEALRAMGTRVVALDHGNTDTADVAARAISVILSRPA